MQTYKNRNTRNKYFVEAFRKWRWLILATIAVSLLWVEIQEFLVLRVLNQAFHYLEAGQYAILIIATGILIESYARSNHAHKQTIRILEFKHTLNLELTQLNEQDALLDKLVELPGKIVDAEECYLLILNPTDEKWNIASHWLKNDIQNQPMIWDPKIPCQRCLEKGDDAPGPFHVCRYDNDLPFYSYSLALLNREIPSTILKFRLKKNKRLTKDEEELFNHIGDEIVAALQINQDRINLLEMQSAEAAMAERRFVSAFVHDQLAQNLGYLHLQLDQFTTNGNINDTGTVRELLTQLKDVANESYEIVRNILRKIQPETVPHLTNLLLEQSRTVSRRAKIALDFKTTGQPIPVIPTIQQPIFFTFCEILNNVEKHANAKKAEVLVMWNHDSLEISVADDGIGFDNTKQTNEEQFGLGIVHERIHKLNGTISINSHIGKGTMISLSIPIKAMDRVPA